MIRNINLIKELILAKRSIDENEILQKLQSLHGVKLAYLDDEEIGLTVWYEVDGNPYLWLGVYEVRGKGIGSKVLEILIEELREAGYKSITARTGMDTIAANIQLSKYGFNRIENGGIYFWKKDLNI